MAKQIFYSIQLNGKQMSNEKFEFLANEVMVGGTKHLYSKKEIEYGIDLYSNAVEDMHALVDWCKRSGLKPVYKGQKVSTGNGEIEAELIRYDVQY